MKTMSLVILFLLASCSSTSAREKEWYYKGAPPEKRVWRYCHTSRGDPEAYFEKGICYKAQKCYKTILRNERCKTEQLYCAYGDVECLRLNRWPSVEGGV